MDDKDLKEKLVEIGAWQTRLNMVLSTIYRDWYVNQYGSMRTRREDFSMPDFTAMVDKGVCPNPHHKETKMERRDDNLVCPRCGLKVSSKRFKKAKELYGKAPKDRDMDVMDSFGEERLEKYKSAGKKEYEKKKKEVIKRAMEIYEEAQKEVDKRSRQIKEEIEKEGLEVYENV